MEKEALIEAFLLVWSAYLWHTIHHSRLDYSLDPSLYGLLTTKLHVALGVVIGLLVNMPSRCGMPLMGQVMLGAYTVRNFYHLRRMRATFAWKKLKAPSPFRSSMMRQQVQLHLGIATTCMLLRQTGIDVSLSDSPSSFMWTRWHLARADLVAVLAAATFLLGIQQLALPPLSKKQKATFKEWQLFRDRNG